MCGREVPPTGRTLLEVAGESAEPGRGQRGDFPVEEAGELFPALVEDVEPYQASGDQHITEHHHHGSAADDAWRSPDSVRLPTVGRAPSVLRDRSEVMARLREAVASADRGQVYVLHGMGGCGKTAVAHGFFQYATTSGGHHGLWVNASDRASLRSGMLAVAADRGAGEGELAAARGGFRPPADLVWDYLDRSDRPWVLVLDNADDPAILRDGSWLRTSPRGIVLVTTRQAAARWWPGADLHYIGVLPREDAAPGAVQARPVYRGRGSAPQCARRSGGAVRGRGSGHAGQLPRSPAHLAQSG
ncbi:AAA family ATPase [Streptomyces sp. NPDC088725]|uniref:AAA family ATPase n=1 Tax=Streptomyces sp. NPDC088725 TaxID=3365873 RepID=UPI0037FC77AC